jgi:type VI secretion system protein ImpM
MPDLVAGLPTRPVPGGVATGFCGKLPARGDFVVFGLPRKFVEIWHDWMQRMLAASREVLGEDWLAVWNVAPIWHFALSPETCGPGTVLGLWMPSVDRVGRQFPLTFAAVAAEIGIAALIRQDGGFLGIAEAAGLDALDAGLDPGEVAARLAPDIPGIEHAGAIVPPICWSCEGALWWRAARDAACDSDAVAGVVAFATPGLPDAETFTRMLQPEKSVGGSECPSPS